MTRSLRLIGRRWAAIMGAGMLLQATGCTFDPTLLATDLTVAFVQSVLTNLVFGSFNLIAP